MTDPRLYQAFDDCLTQLLSGKALEDCLQQYPELEAELRPMLEVAQQIQHLSRVPEAGQSRSRKRLLTAAAQLHAARSTKGSRFTSTLRRALPALAAALLIFVFGATSLYYASASTLPGDSLYPAKRSFETVRLGLATNPADRFTLEVEFAEQRQMELMAVLSRPEAVELDFEGTLVKIDGRQWQIGQFTVQADSQTRVVGNPQLGQWVRVKARSQAGMLTALEIVTQEIEITGPLVNADEQWMIDGVAFFIVPETDLVGTLATGAIATARIWELHNGERVAISITVFSHTTPTATLPATVTPSPTAEATATPSFITTSTPDPTAVVQSSETSEPDEALEPTLEISNTPQPTVLSEPIESPEPSETRRPSETPEPEDTEHLSETPEPEDTQHLSETPEPSETRKPSKTPTP